MANSPTITITVGEYEVLLEASEKLAALEAAGVDNWEGYGDAMADFYDDDEDEEFDDEEDESMGGDFDSGMTSAGFGTDEDYGG